MIIMENYLNRTIFNRVMFVSIIFLFLFSCKKSTQEPQVSTSTAAAPSTSTTVSPSIPTVNVGDGKSELTIDGKTTAYAAGTLIVVKAGTYPAGINIQNLTGVTVQGAGVILDGLNQSSAGYYNTLNLSNLNNVTITGFKTQNSGYKCLNINTRVVNLTLDGLSFTNCLQGIGVTNIPNTIWDGTDATVVLLNLSITNCTFDNVSTSYFGGNIGGGSGGTGKINNLVKNLVISKTVFKNYDGGDAFQGFAVDGFNINNCTFSNVNATNNYDNRLISMVGYGDVHDNTCDTYEGHFAAVNPVSFGTTLQTSHFYNNVCTNSRRYAAFEFQEFAVNLIPGVTSKSNLEVYNNVAGNINTDQWTGYPGTFIDNYQFGLIGGQVSLTNNTGYNWFPAPVNNVLWNLAVPAVATGNVYTPTKQ
jgi:hypothetical protein